MQRIAIILILLAISLLAGLFIGEYYSESLVSDAIYILVFFITPLVLLIFITIRSWIISKKILEEKIFPPEHVVGAYNIKLIGDKAIKKGAEIQLVAKVSAVLTLIWVCVICYVLF